MIRKKLDIERSLTRRIDLIAQSIVGAVLSGNDPEKISFRHVLNRVMLLVQQAFIFIIFLKNEDGTYRRHYWSVDNVKDNKILKRFSIAITSNIEENHLEEKSKLIQLFNSSYYLLPVFVGRKTGMVYEFKSLKNIDITRNSGSIDFESLRTIEDILSYLLNQIFNIENYESYGSELGRLLIQSIEKCKSTDEGERKEKKKTTSVTSLIPNADIRKDVQKKFDELLLKSNHLYLKMSSNGYFDSLFKKNQNNLIHLSKFVRNSLSVNKDLTEKKIAVNYIIFLRDYAVDRDYKRHVNNADISDQGKNYRIRVALCDRQKADMRAHFVRLYEKSQIKNSKNLITKYVSSLKDKYAKDSPENRIRSMAQSLDNWFWSRLHSCEYEKVIEEFIGIMGSYFSHHSRSSADPVFDGIIYFRQQFADGGIERCFPNTQNGEVILPFRTLQEVLEHEKKEISQNANHTARDELEVLPSLSTDLKRLVIAFYWYQGMLPPSEKLNEWVLFLTPIEISGAVWAVVGYFSPSCGFSTTPDTDQYDVLSYDVAWNQCYHLYQDMNARFKKELRISMAKCYTDLLSYFYMQSLDESNKDAIFGNAKTNNELKKAWANWVSLRFAAICELMPYGAVVIDTLLNGMVTPYGVTNFDKFGKSKTSKDCSYVNANFHCRPHFEENHHFPSVLQVQEPERFMRKEDILIALTDAALHPLSNRESTNKKA